MQHKMTMTGRPFLLGWLFLLLSPLDAAGLEPRDAPALAKKWKIPLAAAQAVQELEAERPGWRNEEQWRAWVKRMDAAIDRVTSLAPESKPAWHAVMSHLQKNDRCADDTKVRDRYLSHAWAARDLLRRKSYDCSAWLFHIPALIPATSLLYGRAAEAAPDRDQLLAVRGLRDSLVRDGLPLRSAARLHAQRSYWSHLVGQGLWQRLLTEARSFSQADLELILNGQASPEPVMVDGVQLWDVGYAQAVSDSLQSQWLMALLAAGQRDEARDWMRRWQWQRLAVPRPDSATSFNDEDDHKAARGLAWYLVEDPEDVDAYDLFVGYDDFSHAPLDTPIGHDLAIAYVSRHGYPELAEYLRGQSCGDVNLPPVSWGDFPAEFQAVRVDLEKEMHAVRSGPRNCEPRHSGEDAGSTSVARTELELPPALRRPDDKRSDDNRGKPPEPPLLPPQAKAALSEYQIVRYSESGDLTAAISLSEQVNPSGEVSGGGYWLHMSPDHGVTWREPLYLGLQQYAPYEVVKQSLLPLVRGRVLQIEVEVEEIDPASITFPPVALQTKRSARNLYIELSLDDIERDSDGDGLTDLLENQLLTNSHDPDTDHDGLRDDVDPFPQVSVKAPPVADVDVLRMALHEVFGYDAAAIGTGGPVDENESRDPLALLQSMRQAPQQPRVLFVAGNPAMWQGLTVPGRVVIMTPEQVRERNRMSGPFYPVTFNIWFNHARTKASIIWSAGWTGGTLRFEKEGGLWKPPTTNGWIS